MSFIAALPRYSFLLVDYPGYGHDEGQGRGSTEIVRAVRAAIKAAGIDNRRKSVGILGHSLGAAAALGVLAYEDEPNFVKFDRVVLVSPFLSIPDMAKDIFVPPLVRDLPSVQDALRCAIFPENIWDNRANMTKWITKEAARKPEKKIKVNVIHGDNDEIVPFAQGKALYDHLSRLQGELGHDNPFHSKFTRVSRGDHNNIFQTDFREISSAMSRL